MTDSLVDTNLEFFGTDLERKIKEASANTEPAWHAVDLSKCGLTIWRVEQFRLVPVAEKTYGSFYNGDSYVILSISKGETKGSKSASKIRSHIRGLPRSLSGSIIIPDSSSNFVYNIHFWLGQKTSTDEMGTATYKTVELDTFLQGKAIQYREVQDSESDLFRSYFPSGISILTGGVIRGFVM